jgi:hypothetical protein
MNKNDLNKIFEDFKKNSKSLEDMIASKFPSNLQDPLFLDKGSEFTSPTVTEFFFSIIFGSYRIFMSYYIFVFKYLLLLV